MSRSRSHSQTNYRLCLDEESSIDLEFKCGFFAGPVLASGSQGQLIHIGQQRDAPANNHRANGQDPETEDHTEWLTDWDFL